MKIAIWHNLPSGGGKRALYDQVQGLLGRGHYIEVWCPPTADPNYLPLKQWVKEHLVPLEVEVGATKNPLKRATFELHYMQSRLAAMERHCRQCAQEIEAGKFDLLFAGSCSWFGAAMIGRYVEGPKVIYLQEPRRNLYEASESSPWPALPDSMYRRWKSLGGAKRVLQDFAKLQAARVQVREELKSARSYDEILVNSRFSRESIARSYNLNAQVCYLGIDATKFSPTQVTREPLIIGVGAVDPRKNIEFVIRAVAQIPSPRAPLLWIGDAANQNYVAQITALTEQLDVDLRLKVNVSDAELVDWLNRAQVMAYAPHLEPFGYTPLEANACQTPVVALAEGGIRETVQHGINGLLVDHDPAEMAAGLKQLLEDSSLAQQLGAEGRRQVEERWSAKSANDKLESKLINAAEKYKLSDGPVKYKSG